MKRMAKFVMAGISSLLAGGAVDSLDLDGVVIGSEPIAGAQVQVWKLAEDGTLAERSGYSVLAMNTWIITDALTRDSRGPGRGPAR